MSLVIEQKLKRDDPETQAKINEVVEATMRYVSVVRKYGISVTNSTEVEVTRDSETHEVNISDMITHRIEISN